MMKATIKKCWRDSASLIVLANRNVKASTLKKTANSNYDILLQTRPHTASFSNSIVFPGGVTDEADADESWLRLISSFGYNEEDFASLHKSGCNIPIFADNPVKRHIALRISAIRETFEELGLLICSTEHKKQRSGIWANVVQCNDVKYWQDQISKNPLDLLRLCKEYNCYPDIWSLYFWSSWLTPSHFSKRFDTAFFVTAIQANAVKLPDFQTSQEVVKVEWTSPQEILEKNLRGEVELHPPQGYEFHRLSHFSQLEELIRFAEKRVCHESDAIYSVKVQAKDGSLFVFPGDDLFPNVINYIKDEPVSVDKTVLQLRESATSAHRAEVHDDTRDQVLVLKNYTPKNHINMGDVILPFNAKIIF